MVNLLRHGNPVTLIGSNGTNPTGLLPLVHPDQTDNDHKVTGQHCHDEDEKKGGVKHGVDIAEIGVGISTLHVNEAPCPGTILDKLPKVHYWEETKEDGEAIDYWEGDDPATLLDELLIEIGMPNGQGSL